MTKLLCNGDLYEKVFYDREAHFESLVRQQLCLLLPDFHILPFKAFVQGEEGLRRKPDLAIVHKEYGSWVVVEVELAHHSLERHVYPQLKCFSTGYYDDAHAEYLRKQNPELSFHSLSRMIKYVAPSVMVLVNSKDVIERGWESLSHELGVRLSFLESYRSPKDRVIFRFDGYLPKVKSARLAGARKHEMINALQCRPVDYFERLGGDLVIYYNSRPIKWRMFTTADAALLTPCAPFEIDRNRNYDITLSKDGRLELTKL